jgi:hypothetical protein
MVSVTPSLKRSESNVIRQNSRTWAFKQEIRKLSQHSQVIHDLLPFPIIVVLFSSIKLFYHAPVYFIFQAYDAGWATWYSGLYYIDYAACAPPGRRSPSSSGEDAPDRRMGPLFGRRAGAGRFLRFWDPGRWQETERSV